MISPMERFVMNNIAYIGAIIFLCGVAVWIGEAIVRLAVEAQ